MKNKEKAVQKVLDVLGTYDINITEMLGVLETVKFSILTVASGLKK